MTAVALVFSLSTRMLSNHVANNYTNSCHRHNVVEQVCKWILMRGSTFHAIATNMKLATGQQGKFQRVCCCKQSTCWTLSLHIFLYNQIDSKFLRNRLFHIKTLEKASLIQDVFESLFNLKSFHQKKSERNTKTGNYLNPKLLVNESFRI